MKFCSTGLFIVVFTGVSFMRGAAGAEAKTVPKAGAGCTESQIGQSVTTTKGTLVCLRSGTRAVWRFGASPSTTTTVVAAVVDRPGTVLFKDDFSGFGGNWPSVQNSTGSAGYRDEKFRITVTQPASGVGVRAPVEALSNIVVDVDASIVSTTGQIGLGCYDSGPADVPSRYLATVDRLDRWSISEVRNGFTRVLVNGEMSLGAIHAGDLANRISIMCVGSPGATGRVALALNGGFIGGTTVTNMLAPGAVSLWATSFSTPTINGTTSVDTFWNNMVVRRAG